MNRFYYPRRQLRLRLGEFLLGTLSTAAPNSARFISGARISSSTSAFSPSPAAAKPTSPNCFCSACSTSRCPGWSLDWKRAYHAVALPPARKGKEHPRSIQSGAKGTRPFNWNPLRGPPGVHPKTWISAVAEALEKSHLVGPRCRRHFIETLDKKFEEFGFYDGRQWSNIPTSLTRSRIWSACNSREDVCSGRIAVCVSSGRSPSVPRLAHSMRGILLNWRNCPINLSSSNWTRNCPNPCGFSSPTSSCVGSICTVLGRANRISFGTSPCGGSA